MSKNNCFVYKTLPERMTTCDYDVTKKKSTNGDFKSQMLKSFSLNSCFRAARPNISRYFQVENFIKKL